MELEEIIINHIRQQGPISFRDYMHMCLYYPGKGYYSSGTHPVGWQGDFYTSCTLTPAFGMAIARQLEELWKLLGCKQFTLVECGGGTGKLCRGIMQYLQHNTEFYNKLRYCIIEHVITGSTEDSAFGQSVERFGSLAGIPYKIDCIISNELLDNFAVHRVVMQQKLMEVYVDYENGFKEVLKPAGVELKEYFSALNIQLPRGYCAEVNLQARDWLNGISTALEQGYVLTLDYGYPGSDLYKASRRTGTLVCYHQHLVSHNFYHHIGRQDITAHVNFSALENWGNEQGLFVRGFTDQASFLKRLGFEQLLADHSLCGFLPYTKQALLKYILLQDLGRKIMVLLQGKNVPLVPLVGLG